MDHITTLIVGALVALVICALVALDHPKWVALGVALAGMAGVWATDANLEALRHLLS